MAQESQLAADREKLRESLGEVPPPVVRPPFIVLSGLPGTGKSHFCHQLVKQIPCAVLESDALRKVLFPCPTYSPQESQYLFQVLHSLASKLLSEGIPTILDATNLSERHREYLYHIAQQSGAKLAIVQIKAPQAVVEKRLRQRFQSLQKKDKSDADWQIYQRMKKDAEKIGRPHLVVDTSRDTDEAITKVSRYLRKSL